MIARANGPGMIRRRIGSAESAACGCLRRHCSRKASSRPNAFRAFSGDLRVKQKLPSTRELARRFHIHSNTVSAAYRELHRNGWVAVRKGSGVYVRERSIDQIRKDAHGLDAAIARFLHMARANGHSL